jgi:hypothetical protein
MRAQDHLWSKKKVEEGDGLPDLAYTYTCDAALKKVGFEIIETRDAALDANPGGEEWYKILTPSYFNLFRLQFTPLGTSAATRTARAPHAHRTRTARARPCARRRPCTRSPRCGRCR